MEYLRHYHRWCGVPNTCRWIAVPILTATRHCCSQTCGGVPLCAKTCMCYIMNEWSMQKHVCMNMIVVVCMCFHVLYMLFGLCGGRFREGVDGNG